MKSSIKTLFVVLAIVMSFVAVQAVWAKGGGSDACTVVVAGDVTYVDIDSGMIKVGDITIYGIPLWLEIDKEDQVVVNCFESPKGNYVACYLMVNGELTDLRRNAL